MKLLNWLRSHLLAVLGVAAALFLLAAALNYGTALLARHQLGKQHGQLKADHATSQAQGEAAHTTYRLDSAALATEGQAHHYRDSTLAKSEREILSTRHPRLPLPDAGSLPREGTN